jgi:CubicO group peptidase (beta-lactamase class C family)
VVKDEFGMKSTHLKNRLELNLDKGIEEGVFPGGVSSLCIEDEQPIIAYRGKTNYENRGVLVDKNTIYDLASLTKVVATLPVILLSVQSGRVSLFDPVKRFIPEFGLGADRAEKERITIFHLLTHTSGLPAWRPYFIRVHGRERYIDAISQEALIGRPGEQVVYSDLGFMLLGFILERIWDETLDRITNQMIFRPLSMNQTTYCPLEERGSLTGPIAPTEDGNGLEFKMANDYILQLENRLLPVDSFKLSPLHLDSLKWRKGIIVGTVHDSNTYYGLNGVSGHAGLFSSVQDLQQYMLIWSDSKGKDFFDPVLRNFSVKCHTGSLSSSRAIGWEASSTGGTAEHIVKGCSGGDLVSESAFGHTGFTGTSIWHDPIRQATLITLTNRVHPTVNEGIAQWRKFHHNITLSAVGTR